ncbi:MAG: zinc-ribbon domain-containing protein [Dehalococcoidales bacterium]|nr:zinc-ribbon domain-containing protein [Dehalococcoidales bacterium]
MAFCKNCGNKVSDNASFCGNCGKPIDKKAEEPKESNQNTSSNDTQANKPAASNSKDPITMAVMAYLGPLVLVPIFGAKGDSFIRFHANQGLIVFIIEILWWIILEVYGKLPYMFILSVLYDLIYYGGICVFLLMAILGVISIVKGEEKELPVIGSIRILK